MWTDRALCKGQNPDWWHPDREATHRPETKYAKFLCSVCPVRFECLRDNLDAVNGERSDSGIWGGTSVRKRAVIRKHMKAGLTLEQAAAKVMSR